MKQLFLIASLVVSATPAFAQSIELTTKAIELIQKIDSSGYDNRVLCIVDNNVTAIVPMTHWSRNDRKVAVGTVDNFPTSVMLGNSGIVIEGVSDVVQGEGMNGLHVAQGTVNGKAADICIVEQKPVLE